MIKLDILAVGRLEKDEQGMVVVADSTCTLINTKDGIIVVDPSTDYMRPMIRKSFRQIGVYPKDVKHIVLTHSHSDHVGNLDLFQKAKVYIHSGEEKEIPGAKVIEEDEFQLVPGVRLIHTPGHTKGSMSVFVEAEKRYVIAGDAIPTENNFRKMTPPASNYDPETALQSIKMIKRYADVVIPGHGRPFMTNM